MVGYPNDADFMTSVDIVATAWAKVLELWIPFSDPGADGPLLTTLNHEMVAKGMTPAKALDLITQVKKKYPDIAICIMTYTNPIFHMGYDNFFAYMQQHKIESFLMPEVPAQEFDTLGYKKEYADSVLIVSDNLTDEEIAQVNEKTTGYLYVMSFVGTTGAKENYKQEVQAKLSAFVDRLRRICGPDKKLVIGFGIKSADDIAFLRTLPVDGFIIGSEIAKTIQNSGTTWLQTYVDGLWLA